MHKKDGNLTENLVRFIVDKIPACATVLGRPIIPQTALACQVVKMHKNNAKSSAFCTKTWRFTLFLGHFRPFFGYFAFFVCFVSTKLYEFSPKLNVISRFALAISQFSVNSATIPCNLAIKSSFSASFLVTFFEVSNL